MTNANHATAWRSIPGVAETTLVRGKKSSSMPDLVLEVAHGATKAEHFERLRRELRGTFPDDLERFFFVNTDVGAPEVALRVAELAVAADPSRCALVVRCLVPRTFVDCNRVIDASATSAPGMTPGVHAWVRDARDVELLLDRYRAYRALVTSAVGAVCGSGGKALFVHSYAPRSVDVPVDDRIVEHLRAAYAPEKVESWPLRAEVDLIADTPEGERLASPELVSRARAAYERAGFGVAMNAAYPLHPATLVHAFAKEHRASTLCLELRRDLLVERWTPFEAMSADPAKVDRAARPLAESVATRASTPTLG